MATIARGIIEGVFLIATVSGEPAGTGFLMIRPDEYNSSQPEIHKFSTRKKEEVWRAWFVTCAHVVEAIEGKGGGSAAIKMNENVEGGGITTIEVPLGLWTKHKGWRERRSKSGPINEKNPYTVEDASVDVAVIPAPTSYEKWKDLVWGGFSPGLHLTKNAVKEHGIGEGDQVFMLGFPRGWYKDVWNWPVVRQGIIAQIQPYLLGTAETFLIDGSVFGGNSGGPVAMRPTIISLEGTQAYRKNGLIGMTCGHQLGQTGENADLGIVVPVETINKTIEEALDEGKYGTRQK